MYLSEINVYPIKSFKGISLNEASVEDRGLRFDRRWMLVDVKNKFLTQREFPKMATISIDVNDDGLNIQADGLKKVIPLHPDMSETASVKIWTSSVKAVVYPPAINDWFSEVLGAKCRLVLMPDDAKRKVNPFYAVRKIKDTVSFADGYPFLLIGEGSLADLNSKLEVPVPMNRFRPNFVVSGTGPFAEDTWKKISIGGTIFHVVKPCARCVMTTVDQSKGEKTGREPLKTLADYRTKNGNVLFGQNLIAERSGSVVRTGDKIEVVETK